MSGFVALKRNTLAQWFFPLLSHLWGVIWVCCKAVQRLTHTLQIQIVFPCSAAVKCGFGRNLLASPVISHFILPTLQLLLATPLSFREGWMATRITCSHTLKSLDRYQNSYWAFQHRNCLHFWAFSQYSFGIGTWKKVFNPSEDFQQP